MHFTLIHESSDLVFTSASLPSLLMELYGLGLGEVKPSAHRLCPNKWPGNEKMEESVEHRQLIRLKVIRQLFHVVKQVV